MIIIDSKLTIPKPSPYYKRNRLHNFLDTHLNRSLICLTSGAGYGKTSFVASYLLSKKIPTVWYKLTELDENIYSFLSYLKTGIYRKKLNSYNKKYVVKPEEYEQELANLMVDLAQWPTKLVIVLDGYEEISNNKEIKKALIQFINHMSPNVSFIITSRVRPDLQVVSLKLQNRFVELRTKDLAFTKNETKAFFNDLHDTALKDHEIDIIHKKTEGWIACLQLIQDILRDKTKEERSIFILKMIDHIDIPDLYDYLGNEIVVSEPKEIQTFLYKTSLLEHLDPKVINPFLQIENAENIIDYLLNKHLFIYKKEDGTVKYHNLFRQFLYRELCKRENKVSITEYHRKLSTIYVDLKEYFFAFAHFVASNHFLAAAELMRKIKNRSPATQFFQLIDGFFDRILPEHSLPSTSLFLLRCIPISILKDLIPPLINKINNMLEKNNPVWIVHYQHQLAGAYFYCGELNKADQLLDQAIAMISKSHHPSMESILFAQKSILKFYMGQYEEAIQLAQKTLTYTDMGNFHPHHIALWILSESHLALGNLVRSESILEETLTMSIKRDDCSIIYPYCTKAKLYRLKGKYNDAHHWAEKAASVANKFQLEYDLIWIYIEMAKIFLEENDLENAKKTINKALKYSPFTSYLHAQVLKLQSLLLQKGGKFDEAETVTNEFNKLSKEKNFHWLFTEQTKKKVEVLEEKNRQNILTIKTLGEFSISMNGKPIEIKRKASLLLMQFFITKRGDKILKEHILEEVFPEGSFMSVNNQFYVALSHLRKSVEPNLKSGRDSSFFKQSGEFYYIDTKNVNLDVENFLNFIHDKSSKSNETYIKHLIEATKLYKGDFFEEYPYTSFLQFEREHLKRQYLNTLKKIADYYWKKNNVHLGMEYFNKILEKDPYQEEIYEEYIEKLLSAGMYLNAKKVSKQYEKFVEQELGISVKDKINKLFDHHPNAQQYYK